MKKNSKNIILAITILLAFVLVLFGGWMIVKTTMQKAINKANVEWYNENEKEFIITTAEELYGMMELSHFYDFEGQTVKLGADIVFNKGNASDWSKKAPVNKWYPIEGFKGTFDGQGHTISGIYGKSVDSAMGLFSDTQRGSIIGDFRLVNSYFCGSSKGTGSVSSHGGGTFDTIYTDAIIETSYSYAGGIIGQVSASGEHKITNCWFDGTITMKSEEGIYGGGIAGAISGQGGIMTIEHTLNTGLISAEGSSRAVDVGGFVGSTDQGAVLYVTDSLNASKVNVKYDKLVGALIGDIKSGSKMTASHTYSIQESYNKTVGYQAGTVKGTPIVYPQELIKGYGGYQWMTLDFDNYWAVDMDSSPVLKTFAKEVPKLSGIEKCYNIDWYQQYGTEFTISTLEEFYGFYILSANDNFEGKIVKLGADLAVNEGKASQWGKKAPENPWYPINTFAGIFDGQGYTISGLYVKGNSQKMGMFAETTSGATIQNVKLTNSYFEFTDTTMALLGSIAGRGNGMFDTIYSDAILVCNGTGCGGIVGQVNVTGAQISNCWFDGEIQMKGETGRQVGGILGITRAEVDIDHCLNTSKITVETKGGIRAAGILGIATGNEFTFRITDCLTAGRIYTANSRVGAAVGEIQEGKTAIITDVYAISETLSADEGKTFINKAIGYIAPEVAGDDTKEAIPAAVADGSAVMIPEAGITGYLGYQWTTLNFDKFWSVDLKGTPVLTSFATQTPSVAGIRKKIDVSWYKKDAKTYTIKTAEQLNGFFIVSALTDFEGKTVRLGKNITVNKGNAEQWATKRPSDMWYPINTFAGTFDGRGYTISGLYLKSPTQKIGFFAETTPKAVVKNFKLTNSYMESTSTGMAILGSVVGRGDGRFDTIYSDVILVCSGTGCGGIVGQVYTKGNNKITNCWYDGKMNVTTDKGKQVGGILGIAREGVTIEHCLNSADIKMEAEAALRVGGLVGIMTGSDPYKVTINDCLNAGNITTANSRVGAIVAEVQADKKLVLKNTYALAEGMTTGKAFIKKLIGHVDDAATTEGVAALIPADLLNGANAGQWTTLDFAKYWRAKEGSTPELASFTAGENLNVASLPKKSDISWYNMNKDNFVIDSKEDLYGLYIMSIATKFAGETIKIGANIDFNSGDAADWATTAPENVWYPLNTIAGTIDGQGNRISGLYLKSSNSLIGFISQMEPTAVVKNLKITNSYMESTSTGSAWLGTFAGRGNGTFDTVYSDAIIVSSGTGNGGIIGQTYYEGTKINNAWFDGSITLTTEMGVQAGGIVGIARESIAFSNCLNTGTISVEHNSGVRASGILGIMTGDEFEVTMNNCLTTGRITAADARVGVIVGEVQENKTLKLNEVYATAESHYDGAKYITRAVGHSEGEISGTGVIVPESSFTGSGAYLWTTFDFENVWAAKADSTPELLSFTTGENMNVVGGMRADTSWYDKKDYNIDTVEELCGLAKLSWNHDFEGITITLDNKKAGETFKFSDGAATKWAKGLELPEHKWISIGSEEKPFAGTFDGQGNSISGIYMETVGKYAGLFAKVTGTVQNLNLTNSYLGYKGYKDGWIGSITGSLCGTLDTVKSDAIVYSNGLYTGGMVGSINSEALLDTCWFDGSVELEKDKCQYAAGMVGQVFAEDEQDVVIMKHCLNTGAVTGERTDSTILGLSGLCSYVYQGQLNISDSLHAGTINGTGTRRVYLIARGETLVSCEDTYYSNDQGLDHAVWGDKCTKNNGTKGLSSEALKGATAKLNEVTLDEGHWVFPQGETPQLKAFSDLSTEVFNWEGEGTKESPWLLSTSYELLQFAEIAKGYNFSGKYIQLKNSITIDNGNQNWTPIGTEANAFAGTFDGNNKTIRGVQYKGTDSCVGLFGCTSPTSVVKNFTLAASTFEHTSGANGDVYIGSIVGKGYGLFEKIKSEAIVISNSMSAGGIAGGVLQDGDANFTECWFAGTLTLTGSNGRRGGGIVGKVSVGTGKSVIIEHCLNTGSISATRKDWAQVGGICGILDGVDAANPNCFKITDCLNAKRVVNEGSTVRRGAILGQVSPKNFVVQMTDTYAINERLEGDTYDNPALVGYLEMGSSVNATDCAIVKSLIGNDGWYYTSLDFENYWNAVEGTTPQLKHFANGTALAKWTGMGTEESPWIITSKAELEQLATLSETYDFVGKYFSLGTAEQAGKLNIPVNEGTVAQIEAAKPNNWKPIGSSTKPFAGTFNGNGNTISGIYYKGNGTYVGLFGSLGSSGVIKNLVLLNSTFEHTGGVTSAKFGSIAGYSEGRLEQVKSDATIKSNAPHNGGLVGYAQGGTITRCWYDGTMTLGTNGKFSGGIVGNVVNGTVTISNCLFSKSIYGDGAGTSAGYGGLCGQVDSGGTLKLENSLAYGSVGVSTTSNWYGSIVGYIYGTGVVEVSNTYTQKDICRFAYRNRSGSIKYNGSTLTGNIENSTYAEALTTDQLKGANASKNTKLDFTNCWQEVSNGFPVIKFSIGGSQTPEVVEWAGEGTQGSPYIIDNEAELRLLVERLQENGYKDTYFKLGENITVTGGTTSEPANWEPIGTEEKPFAGTFDGNGKTISGISYKGNGTYIGLFGSVASTGTIKNLKLADSIFEHTGGVTSAKLGSIAGYSVGKIEKVKSTATVKSNAPHNGGLVGWAEGGSIIECWYDGEMTLGANGKFSGGIVGNVINGTVTIKNCLFSKSIYGDGAGTSAGYGGLCGQVESNGTLKLEDSLVYGSVGVSTTSNWYGSIVGYIYGTGVVEVSNTYTKKDICRFAYRNRSGSIKYNGSTLTGNIENSTYAEALTQEQLKGTNASKNAKLDFTNYWKEVTEGFPVLKNCPN